MPESLTEVLSWVQACLRDDAAPEPDAIDAYLLSSSRLSAADRLQIHAEQYWHHVRDVLAAQLPCMVRFMGPDAFNALMWHYVRACPTRTFSTHHIKKELPGFLLSTDDFIYRSFLRELAILEIACDEVRWAVPQARMTGVAPDRQRPPALVDSLQLLTFQHRVLDYVLHEGETDRTEWGNDVEPNWLLVMCTGDRLEHWRLTQQEYHDLMRLRERRSWPGADEVVNQWLDKGLFAAGS